MGYKVWTHHKAIYPVFFFFFVFPTSLIEYKIQVVDLTTSIPTATGIVIKPRINVSLQNI